MIDTDHWAVGRDRLYLETVEAAELQRLYSGSTGHAAYRWVHRDQVLEREQLRMILSDLAATPSLISTAVCRPARRKSAWSTPIDARSTQFAPSLRESARPCSRVRGSRHRG
jgi:hypothetical protein